MCRAKVSEEALQIVERVQRQAAMNHSAMLLLLNAMADLRTGAGENGSYGCWCRQPSAQHEPSCVAARTALETVFRTLLDG